MNLFSFNSAISADLMLSTSDIESIKSNDISTSESLTTHSMTNTSAAELALSLRLHEYAISVDSINLSEYKNPALHFINLNTAAQSIENEQQPSQLKSIPEESEHLLKFQIYQNQAS